jgi:DNA-binding transcriptional LysR family regulator
MVRDVNVDQIRKLWILDLVLRHGSLKKAALTAKVSPSAISQSLTSLEKSLGKILLIKAKGSINPTPDALVILDIVRPAFAAFDRLRELNAAPFPKINWINFGTYESIAIDLLPGLLQSLRRKMPNLRLRLRISRTANLLNMIRKGDLCSALITEVDDLEKFYVKQVAEDRLGLYASKGQRISSYGWSAIREFGLGSLAPGPDGLPRYYTRFLRQHNLAKPSILSDSFETLRAAAAAGSVIAILPNRVAKRSDDLIELKVGGATEKSSKETGRHKILIVSQRNCDRQEVDFLAEEATHLLGRNF